MNDKKNIDRLFQEKFKDFEVTPPDFVWDNIQSRLEEKKKRRVIPLWFKFSGVAAILVVGIFVLAPYLNNTNGNNNSVVIDAQEKNPDGSERITPVPDPVKENQSVNESAVASEENDNAGNNDNRDSDNTITGAAPYQTGNDAVASSENGAPAVKKRNAPRHRDKQPANDAVVSASNSNRIRSSGSDLNNRTEAQNANAIITAEKAVAENNNAANKNISAGNNASAKNENQTGAVQRPANLNSVTVKEQEGIAANKNTVDNKISGNSVEKNNNSNTDNSNVLPNVTTQNAVAQTEAIDTATVAEPENELEKLLREKLNGEDKKEEAVAEANERGKWNIKPQMAPLFFNTASQGSPIDADLASNGKDFDNDLSYGVGVHYAVSDRISIRSGINTVNMKYSTNDVAFHASFSNEPFSSVVAPSGPNANLSLGPAANSEATDNLRTESLDGSLVQKIGFVEVPLEMSYKLVNRKFGIDLIGGISTLILSDNNISLLTNQGYSSNMGEANNINSVSFTTNVGVGFKYRIINSLEASFEPMFKYQLNTFSNNSGNFRPYFIGLYSGISFSF